MKYCNTFPLLITKHALVSGIGSFFNEPCECGVSLSPSTRPGRASKEKGVSNISRE